MKAEEDDVIDVAVTKATDYPTEIANIEEQMDFNLSLEDNIVKEYEEKVIIFF